MRASSAEQQTPIDDRRREELRRDQEVVYHRYDRSLGTPRVPFRPILRVTEPINALELMERCEPDGTLRTRR